MLRFLAAFLTIVSVLATFSSPRLIAQAPVADASTSASPSPTPDRSEAIKRDIAAASNTQPADPANFDPNKAETINNRQARKGWSTTDKVLLGLAIVGAAALLFVVIKYGKACLRTNTPNCTPGVDEGCICEEYERRIPQQ